MNSLAKRVETLERQKGINGEPKYFFVALTSDGGFVYDGKFYPDDEALSEAFGGGPVLVVGWKPG